MASRMRLNNNKNNPRRLTLWAALVLMATALGGCGKGGEQGGGGWPGMGGPAAVTAVTVQPQAVPLILEYPAQLAGSREVEIRARVRGILLKRNYTEGERVKAGQTLFTLDAATYEAAVDNAVADLAAAEARLTQANREAVRLKPLFEAEAVSQLDYDNAVSAQAIAAADAVAAQARLKEARLDLQWTRVESPISGIAGRALPSEGSFVTGPEVLLTNVTQLDPIYVLFGIPDNERLKLRQAVAAGKIEWPADGRLEVTLLLADGSEYAQRGRVSFTDVRVNPDTGTSESRAELPNPDAVLQAGQFVRVRLSGALRKEAFSVPQRAVLEGPQGKFVYVIDAENKAAIRPVQVAEWNAEDWIITEGLHPGEQVIVDGVMKLGPGAPVQVGEAPPPGGWPQGEGDLNKKGQAASSDKADAVAKTGSPKQEGGDAAAQGDWPKKEGERPKEGGASAATGSGETPSAPGQKQ